MVNMEGTPVHPFAEGVTVMIAVALVEPVLVAVKEGMFPVPLAASPIVVLLLVHEKVVPVTVPLRGTEVVTVPLQ